jgi:hypothetical protein
MVVSFVSSYHLFLPLALNLEQFSLPLKVIYLFIWFSSITFVILLLYIFDPFFGLRFKIGIGLKLLALSQIIWLSPYLICPVTFSLCQIYMRIPLGLVSHFIWFHWLAYLSILKLLYLYISLYILIVICQNTWMIFLRQDLCCPGWFWTPKLSNPSTSASQVTWTTCMCHCA